MSFESVTEEIVELRRSLKNHGVEHEANDMFDMGRETMDLPLEEKMKYEQGDGGSSFGYALSPHQG